MSNYLSEDGTFINSLIGDGTVFKGELKLDGLLRIDGDFSGTVETDGKVLVGKNGRVDAVIEAGTVVVGGVLKGNIRASEKVVVLSTGMLIGNIVSPRLLVEDGVLMNGTCTIIPEKTPAAEVPASREPAGSQETEFPSSPGGEKKKRRNFFFPASAKAEAKAEKKEKEMETASSWKE